jgi:hypothetical protein
MKKARIFLTALAVLAIVGGALGFKAKTLYPYYACDPNVGYCTIPATFTFQTTLGGNIIVNYDELNAPCKGTICQTKVKVSD